MSDVTRILQQIERGQIDSSELVPLVYDELRRLAAVKMSHERLNHTLDATGLVHEAFLRLVGTEQDWDSRRHFFAAAAEAMRRILVDRARAKGAQKRGGQMLRAHVDLNQLPTGDDDERLLALDAALTRFAQLEPEKSQLVELRYFAGLPIREAAKILDISTATADRHWAYAKAWLQSAIRPADDSPE